LALIGIAPHDLKMDTTIVDLVISELERAEVQTSNQIIPNQKHATES